MLLILIFLVFLHKCYCDVGSFASPSFGYENNTFLLDGKPFRFIAGSIHYFRIHPALWDDRLKRVRAAGLNAIQFYIPWNFHEIEKRRYSFDGSRNVKHFIELAAKNELKVLLRVGPYACGEWENGGLPWWLLNDKDIKMRTSDPRFTSEVKKWFDKLLPLIVPFLHRNGGPILMVQVENEYGSFGSCDHVYTKFLRDLTQMSLGSDIMLYTTDWADENALKCAGIPGVLTTIDFGPSPNREIEQRFAIQRKFAPNAPFVNSEFYPGWFVLWGQKKQQLPSDTEVIESASYMYHLGASFSFYMIHGGTNFDFWNGAEESAPATPISEAGDITPQYIAIRNWISSLEDWSAPPKDVPPNNPKMTIDDVQLSYIGRLDSYLLKNNAAKRNCASSRYPLSFEELRHPFGFVIYFTTLKFSGSNLTISSLKDYGFTSVDGQSQGVFVNRFGSITRRWLILHNVKQGSRLSIVVENQGRQTYETINDFKGILSNVTLDGRIIEDWTQCGIDFKLIHNNLQRFSKLGRIKELVSKKKYENEPIGAGIYFGSFTTLQPADTFFNSTGWNKGVLLINGKNLGRYWSSAGPQVTLYVPSPILRYRNYVLLFELEAPTGRCSDKKCSAQFLDHPVFKFESSISN